MSGSASPQAGLYPHHDCNVPVKGNTFFAINKLGFKVENIVVSGWSIGGYTSTWLAMNYPDIKGLVSRPFKKSS